MCIFSRLLKIRSVRSTCRIDHSNWQKWTQFNPRLESLELRQLMATDVILEWNEVMLTANAADHSGTAEQGGPILTARAFAMVSGAMYDAYNSIERMGAPFIIRAKVKGKSDSDAAVAQAAHDTLLALYPSQRPRFDAALSETLARTANGEAEDRGRAVGAKVAKHILADRSVDGVVDLMKYDALYHPKELPGFHKADPMNPNQGYYAPGAAHILPFVLADLDQFQARRLDDGTTAGRLAFMRSAEYTAAYDEVFSLGSDGITAPTARTAEQTQIGVYWGYDGRPGLGTPPRLYNQIARTIANQQNNSIAENARLFALINIAQADGGLTAWNGKYDDDFWRPIMGIREADKDGNPQTFQDADWTPLGAPASNPRLGEMNFTPPFPAYVSGHAAFGASVFQTMKRFYGRDDIPFTFISDELNGITRDANGSLRQIVPRTFQSFSQAKLENGQSRIYLGIHWAFDRDDGIKTGDDTANFIFDNALRPKSSAILSIRHNTFDPLDVDDDGEYTPLDVLRVINMVNTKSSASPDFVDVNDDSVVSALDALLIINQINLFPPARSMGEGEQAATHAESVLPWFTIDRSPETGALRETCQSQEIIGNRSEDPKANDSDFVQRNIQSGCLGTGSRPTEVEEAWGEQATPGLTRMSHFRKSIWWSDWIRFRQRLDPSS